MTYPNSSRRAVLTGAAALGASSLSGCANLSLGATEEPTFKHGSQVPLDQQPLTNTSSSADAVSLQAAVFTAKQDMHQRIKWSALPKPTQHLLRTTDYSTHFIATLIADTQLVSPTTNTSWCPTSSVDGDQFVFQLPVKQWPTQKALKSPSLVGKFEQWKIGKNAAPSRAVVEIEFLAPDEDKICGE
ncbi:hypothetical protein [Haladaptatus caseinilyticus]|uniref:hypothetical protein n=1 Tax=Haladaptatus caseinilyticus TaxID=2993314 RepID=UPI00224B42B5|nr:hypothetical protein [Haladaptatus caseinilyticus]